MGGPAAVEESVYRAAAQLTGMTLNERWAVLERLPSVSSHTTSIFSVGYLVQDIETGASAFCKALDYSAAFEADDPEVELRRLADSFIFERDLLDHCGRNRMTRIVRTLDSGRIRVQGAQPPMVSFLVFERADSDSRDILESQDDSDAVVALALAHDCAVALSQLHRYGISHQDVKPANLLGWRSADGSWSGKLGDLGRAFCASMSSPHADLCCPGDTNWAAPEILYGLAEAAPRSLVDRKLADLFGLGSLICYLLTGVPYGGILALNLAPEHRWAQWQGGYDAARSFLADAHEHALDRVRGSVHSEAVHDVVPLIAELCHPDVRLRARPGFDNSKTGGRAAAPTLERYVSRLNLLHHRISVARTRGERE